MENNPKQPRHHAQSTTTPPIILSFLSLLFSPKRKTNPRLIFCDYNTLAIVSISQTISPLGAWIEKNNMKAALRKDGINGTPLLNTSTFAPLSSMNQVLYKNALPTLENIDAQDVLMLLLPTRHIISVKTLVIILIIARLTSIYFGAINGLESAEIGKAKCAGVYLWFCRSAGTYRRALSLGKTKVDGVALYQQNRANDEILAA